MIIFAYRLAWDTGFAPCLDHNVFTLACCKGGQVRRGKDIFTGLRYQIGQYRSRNPEDQIYDVKDDMLFRNDALPHIHPKGEVQIRQEWRLCIDFKKLYIFRDKCASDFRGND